MGLDFRPNSSENNLNAMSYNDVLGNFALPTFWREFSIPARPIQNPTVFGGIETRPPQSSNLNLIFRGRVEAVKMDQHAICAY